MKAPAVLSKYYVAKTWPDFLSVSLSPRSLTVWSLCQNSKSSFQVWQVEGTVGFLRWPWRVVFILRSSAAQQHHRESSMAAVEWCLLMLSVDVTAEWGRISLTSLTGLTSALSTAWDRYHTLYVLYLCVWVCVHVWMFDFYCQHFKGKNVLPSTHPLFTLMLLSCTF